MLSQKKSERCQNIFNNLIHVRDPVDGMETVCMQKEKKNWLNLKFTFEYIFFHALQFFA